MSNTTRNYGSQHWLQVAVNEFRDLIDRELSAATQTHDEIEWISPLAPDYTEFHDQGFLDNLRLSLPNVKLKEFWPNGGPGRASGRTGFNHFAPGKKEPVGPKIEYYR